MKVLYNGETIELKDKLTEGATSYDIFSDSINLEDTIEFDPNTIFESKDISFNNLEKTIKIGDDNNEWKFNKN